VAVAELDRSGLRAGAGVDSDEAVVAAELVAGRDPEAVAASGEEWARRRRHGDLAGDAAVFDPEDCRAGGA
jgi:hypothetical protein